MARASRRKPAPAERRPPAPRIPRADAIIAAVLVAWAAAMAMVLLSLASQRSFHQDELHVLAVEKKAEAGIELESQHRHYHALMQWWLADTLDHRHARIPSIAFAVLAMLSLALLAWRMAGRTAAIAAAAVYTLWPRLWDDALEMRYYALVFLAATLGLHALLWMARGAALLPSLAQAILLAVMARWHPTAIPFHAGLCVVSVGVCAWRLTLLLLRWAREKSRPAPLDLVPPAVVLLASVTALAVAGPRVYAELGGGAIGDRWARLPSGSYNPLDLARWLVAWVDDRFAPGFPPVRILRITFPLLLGVGLWRLWRINRLVAGTAVALLLCQLALAGVFSLGWARVVVGYKYITSSSVLLVLGVALGALWIVQESRRRGPRAARTAATLLLLGYALPILPRVHLSAMGDASHFIPFWQRVMREGGARPPILFATTETTQSVRPYTLMMPEFAATVCSNLVLTPEVVPTLFARDQRGLVALAPSRLAQMPWRAWLEPVASWRSNFSPDWDIELMRPAGDARLAAGQALALSSIDSLLVLEEGHWRTEGTAALDPAPPWAAGTLVRVSGAAAGARLVPDYAAGPARRSPMLAQRGPLNDDTRPRIRDGVVVYTLASVDTVEYDFHLAGNDMHLVVEFSSDHTDRDGFMVLFDGVLEAIATNLDPLEPGAAQVHRVAVPEGVRGRTARVSLARLRDSDRYLSPDAPLRALHLRALSLELATPELPPTPNLLDFLRPGAPPGWAPGGVYDPGEGGVSMWTASVPTRGEPGIAITRTADGLRAALARDLGEQGFYAEPFPIRPGDALVAEVTLRMRHAIAKSAVPFIYFLGESGSIISLEPIGGRPIGASDADWTTRTRITEAPPGAMAATIAIVINSPPATRTREDAALEIQRIRFLMPKGNGE